MLLLEYMRNDLLSMADKGQMLLLGHTAGKSSFLIYYLAAPGPDWDWGGEGAAESVENPQGMLRINTGSSGPARRACAA